MGDPPMNKKIIVTNLLLPERIHNEELGNGPHKGKPFKKEDFIEMLQLYYQKRGWDKNGFLERIP